ncbi:MAG: 5-oxoprolinase [Bacillota bacterium]|nr:MAG: 5-oxoprolinase [Bacillota bacterium]
MAPPLVDPITAEVIRSRLLSAAGEMMRTLKRTAYDTVVYEIQDFGLGLYDRQCRLLAEAPGLAVFTRSNDYALRRLVDHLGEESFEPGDVVLLNYPYWSGAHILDVLSVSPIYAGPSGDRLVGYTAAKVHWLDLGQKDPGYCLDTTDLHQEGLILPGVKICRRGQWNQELESIIRFNSRLPDRVIGNLHAQVACLRVGEQRVREIVDRFGLDTFQEAVQQILDHGERVARSRLAQLPKGTWSAEGWVDHDGIDRDTMLRLKVTVTITDDAFTVDLTGSHDMVRGPVNLTLGDTMGVSALAFKGLTTPDLPANEGHFRPLRVIAPEGTLVHAVPPAPTFTAWPSLYIPELIMQALAGAMPDRIPACSGGDICSVMLLGTDARTGRMWLEANNDGVGFGGHAGGDGESGIMHLSEPGSRNNPVEVMETRAPILVERYALRTDSGGPGRHRGGLGVERVYRFLQPGHALAVVLKTKTRPWGLAGGREGAPNQVVLRAGTARGQVTGKGYEAMGAGGTITNLPGGGGGWGDPFTRDPEKVRDDVRSGYVSVEAARRDYGVAVNPATFEIDWEETRRLRASR